MCCSHLHAMCCWCHLSYSYCTETVREVEITKCLHVHFYSSCYFLPLWFFILLLPPSLVHPPVTSSLFGSSSCYFFPLWFILLLLPPCLVHPVTSSLIWFILLLLPPPLVHPVTSSLFGSSSCYFLPLWFILLLLPPSLVQVFFSSHSS